jgi:hypothetical protein
VLIARRNDRQLHLGTTLAQAMAAELSVITGTPETGRLVRATRIAQLRIGATLRLGLVWAPTVHLGLGVGARVLSAADLHFMDSGRPLDVTPDGMDTSFPLDFIAVARVGLG